MNKKLNFAVIFNANAAGGRKLKLINKVIYLLEKNHIVDLFKTESEDHARKVFKELSNKKFDRLVFAGGDGSVCFGINEMFKSCLLYTSPSPRDGLLSRMPSSA